MEARDDHEPPEPPSAARRELAGLVVPLAAFVILAVLALVVEHVRDASGLSTSWTDGVVQTDTDGAATGEAELVARVRGKILLEAIDERELIDPDFGAKPPDDAPADEAPSEDPTREPEPAPTVDTDGEPGDTDGEPADTEGERPARAPELAPPPAGSCRIVAWQAGVQVGGPVTCDAQGEFEIELMPGIAGVTAFELEVPGRLRAVVETDVPAGSLGRLPPVALGLGQPLSGLVTDARNVPLADVVVEARPVPDLAEPEPWRARTDAAGKFAFDTLPPGPITIRCAPAGYAPSVVDVIAPQADVLVVLDALLVLSGEVVGPPDVLARTVVRVEGSGVWPAREAPLDAGAFAMPEIPDGVYGIEAVAAATEPGQPEFASIPLENVAPDQHVTLALAQAYRVPVRVVDRDDNPIAGARVTLDNAHIGLLQRVARTGADGRTAIGPVVSGPYVVRADADGMLAGDPVAVGIENATPEEVVLVLGRPARIAGIVVDQYDRPVEGAVVEVGGEVPYSAGEGSARARVFDRTLVAGGSLGVTTGPVPDIPVFMPDRAQGGAQDSAGMLVSDADGRFVLADLAPGPYRLQASHGRYAMSDVVLVTVKATGGSYEVRLRLRHGERVTGRVLDGNLRPIAGASVDIDGGTVWTDERGVFDAGPRTGTVVLVARAEGTVPVRREIEVGSRPVDVELVLARAEAVVRGHVVDDNLRPLANVRVTLRSDEAVMATELAWTDDRGEFAFETLPLGVVELELDAPGHAARTVKARAVEAGREVPIEIVMVAGWRLTVDVRDRDTDDPIVGAAVVCDGVFARTDARGLAAFDALSADEVELEVTADDYGRRDRTVRRKGDRVEVVVELAQGGSLEGVVTDWRGDPIAAAQVVIKVGEHVVAERTSDAQGRFTADGIPEGDIVLEAWPPADREDDLAPVAQRSDVLRGRTTRGIDLRLERR